MWCNGGSDRTVEVESGGRGAGCVGWITSVAAVYAANVAANVEEEQSEESISCKWRTESEFDSC